MISRVQVPLEEMVAGENDEQDNLLERVVRSQRNDVHPLREVGADGLATSNGPSAERPYRCSHAPGMEESLIWRNGAPREDTRSLEVVVSEGDQRVQAIELHLMVRR